MKPLRTIFQNAGRIGLAAAVLATATEAGAQPTTANYGARIAKRSCSQCHAIGEVGDSPNAAAPRFRELHRRFVVQDLQERLLEQLMIRHTGMPQFHLTMEELTGLIAYLKSIQTDLKSQTGPAAGGVARGAA
jgi:mono/diheme cytochrome c family protein